MARVLINDFAVSEEAVMANVDKIVRISQLINCGFSVEKIQTPSELIKTDETATDEELEMYGLNPTGSDLIDVYSMVADLRYAASQQGASGLIEAAVFFAKMFPSAIELGLSVAKEYGLASEFLAANLVA